MPRSRRDVRIAVRLVVVLLVVAVGAGTAGFIAFRQAVHARNEAVPEAARRSLDPASGSVWTTPQVTLVVGADTSRARGEADGARGSADSMMLVRIDRAGHSVSMLSIPRDLYVPIPGQGRGKIGSAYARGGLARAISAVRATTKTDVHHVMLVDFDGFRHLVDSLGGVTIDNPFALGSGTEPFDGRHWTFPAGRIEFDGRYALAYARLRKVDDASIAANPMEAEELGRARRQQRVLDAVIRRLESKATLRHPIRVPRAAIRPITTDIGASTLVLMGVAARSADHGRSLRCRLGGSYDVRSGARVLIPDEHDDEVVQMFLGSRPPQAPRSAEAGGCERGTAP